MRKQKKNIIVSVPSKLMKNFLANRKPGIVNIDVANNIIDYAVYNEEQRTKKSLTEVYKALDLIVTKGDKGEEETDKQKIDACMLNSWRHGKEIAERHENITSKSTFHVSLTRLFALKKRLQGENYDSAICSLMYWALGSIQGNADYQKTNDVFLLSRMNGNDKPEITKIPQFVGESKAKKKYDAERAAMSQRQQRLADYVLQDEIKAIGTRRKIMRYKKLLADKYQVAFYSKARGFYFSTKLKEDELKKRVEEIKAKKPFRKRAS